MLKQKMRQCTSLEREKGTHINANRRGQYGNAKRPGQYGRRWQYGNVKHHKQ
jgi:hypothetical protein